MSILLAVPLLALGSPAQPSVAEPPPQEVVDGILERLSSEELPDQFSGRMWLKELGESAVHVAPAVANLLTSDNSMTRANAAFALADIGVHAAECVPLLTAALNDKDRTVRYACASALGSIGKPAEPATKSLIRLLDDDRSSVRLAAAGALCSISRNEVAIPTLIKGLSDESKTNRMTASLVLGQYGPKAKQAAPVLKLLFLDEEEFVRINAAEALWLVAADPVALVTLRQETESSELSRYSAASKLWKIDKSPRAFAVLIDSLQHKDSTHRVVAAVTLGWIGPPARSAIPALKKLEADEDESVRSAAAISIERIKSTGK
jgi:HEAT repeat protein